MPLFGAGANLTATGTLTITTDASGALLVEAAGGTDILNVDTVAPLVTIGADISFVDKNIVLGVGTGSKIGTATTQKLAFHNSTPIAQQAGTVELVTAFKALGLMAAGSTPITAGGAFTASSTAALNGTITIGDTINVVLNAGTGTKIGTATSQKLGFWNSAPIIQPVVTADLLDSLQAAGLIASGAGNTPLDLSAGAVGCGTITLTDSANIVLNTGTGTKIGTAVGQKLGFWNALPVIQQASAVQALVTATVGSDIGAFTDPPSGAEMALLRTFVNALKADNAALIVLANRLRLDLVTTGIIKGAA